MRMKFYFGLSLAVGMLVATSCSNRQVVYTERAAYYLGDDSLDVVNGLEILPNGDGRVRRVNTDSSWDSTRFKAPVPIEQVKPEYPNFQVGHSKYIMEGTTWVAMFIADDGVPKRAYVIKTSDGVFNRACLDAAMQWRFKPALENGVPVSVWVSIPFRFRIQHSP